MKELFAGIDPGVTGATTLITDDYDRLDIHILPHKAGPHELAEFINIYDIKLAVLELVSSSPQQGVKSAFTFGQSFGFVQGLLIAMEIPYQEVRPQAWLKGLGIRKKRKEESNAEWKRFLALTARKMFPTAKGVNQATADSLLIAEFARRLYRGKAEG